MSRGPTVKAAIKRLTNITITEIKKLSLSDIKNITKLYSVIATANSELLQRQMVKETAKDVCQPA